MALWMVRIGRYGQYETQFFQQNRIYATWEGLNHDLSAVHDQQELRRLLQEVYPDWYEKKAINYASQLWPFAHSMAPKDWVVTPLRSRPAIAFGEITGPYEYDASAPDPYYHSRTVKWFAPDVPRSVFEQDLLYSFGAFMTICQISRNDAESRVRALAAAGWKGSTPLTVPLADTLEDATQDAVDLERLARDQIAKLVIRQFKGHGMALLVDAILRAQGYTTFRSPEGADKGVDIVAAPGPLGFGQPRLCVQVKSEEHPIEHSVLTQLVGSMQHVQAQQGLLVAWGGFKQSIERDRAAHFFRVRLWDQDDLIDALLEQYDRLPEEIRTKIPLKRSWTVTTTLAEPE